MTITPTSVLLSLASAIPVQGRPQVQGRIQPAAPAPDAAKPATEHRAKMPQNLANAAPEGAKAPPVDIPRGTFLDIIV